MFHASLHIISSLTVCGVADLMSETIETIVCHHRTAQFSSEKMLLYFDFLLNFDAESINTKGKEFGAKCDELFVDFATIFSRYSLLRDKSPCFKIHALLRV